MSKKLLLVAFGLLFLPEMAQAHGIGQVYALPVPLHYYLAGAGAAVALSFFILAIFLKKAAPSEKTDKIIKAIWLNNVVKILQGLSVFLLVLTIATGIIGTQSPLQNFTPAFFWIYFLVGTGVLSLFIGNIWQKINPFKVITDWVYSDSPPRSRKISGAVSIVLLLGLFWLEMVSGVSFVPRMISLVLTVYTLINLLGAKLYANWYEAGEVFSALFSFIGTLAHFRLGENNKSFVVVNETKKLDGRLAPWWILGLATVLLAGTSFDSFKESVLWFHWLKVLGLEATKFPETIAIILAPLPFLFSYLLAVWLMKLLVGKQYKTAILAQQFVWSLIPIAFGYALAHNFSLTIVTAPQMLAIISDPFGFGWNLFGTVGLVGKNLLLGAKMVWFVEIGFVILAHIVGVWYAHVLATNIFKNSKLALKSQVPIVLLMVGYTVMTLWLLSQPLVIAK